MRSSTRGAQIFRFLLEVMTIRFAFQEHVPRIQTFLFLPFSSADDTYIHGDGRECNCRASVKKTRLTVYEDRKMHYI